MFDVHVPRPYQDTHLPQFQMFGNGHHSIAQRWKAGDLLLHQSRAANKHSGVTPSRTHQTDSADNLARVVVANGMSLD